MGCSIIASRRNCRAFQQAIASEPIGSIPTKLGSRTGERTSMPALHGPFKAALVPQSPAALGSAEGARSAAQGGGCGASAAEAFGGESHPGRHHRQPQPGSGLQWVSYLGHPGAGEQHKSGALERSRTAGPPGRIQHLQVPSLPSPPVPPRSSSPFSGALLVPGIRCRDHLRLT